MLRYEIFYSYGKRNSMIFLILIFFIQRIEYDLFIENGYLYDFFLIDSFP